MPTNHARSSLSILAGLALAALLACLVFPQAGEAKRGGAKRYAAGGVFLETTTFRMTRPDEKRRSAVTCPGGKTVVPLGGGMTTSPGPASDGEGVYPHSYERLGAQRGFHVTPVLYDPSPGKTTPRDVTMQVVCAPKSTHIVPVRNTVYVDPGKTKTARATCPGQRRLFAGGFQRTNFVSRGGNFATSSFSSSEKSWTVSGSAFGNFGGELTAIAYCRSSARPLLTEVSAQVTVEPGEYAEAMTVPCPGGRLMVTGGFSTFPADSALITDGSINPDGTWSTGAYNAFGPPTTLTAYGYCHSPRFPAARKGEENPHRSAKAPPALKRAEKAAMSERVLHGGCYPNPSVLARGIRKRTGLRTGVASDQDGVNHASRIYVLSKGASCDVSRLSMLRDGRVFTINSATGMVSVK
jgi:hypothetical protein